MMPMPHYSLPPLGIRIMVPNMHSIANSPVSNANCTNSMTIRHQEGRGYPLTVTPQASFLSAQPASPR